MLNTAPFIDLNTLGNQLPSLSQSGNHFRGHRDSGSYRLAFGKDLTDAFVSTSVQQVPQFFTDKWFRKSEELKPSYASRGYDLIKLSIGGPQEAPSPVFLDALSKAAADPAQHKYTHTQGSLPLREGFLTMLRDQFHIQNLDSNRNILITDGINAVMAYFIQQVLKNPNGQGVILAPTPGYPTFDSSIQLAGFKKVPLNLSPGNGYAPDPNEAVKALTDQQRKNISAIILNYPNNPTGAHASKGYIQKVLDFAYKNQILVISDMAYGYYKDGKGLSPQSVYAVAEELDQEKGLTGTDKLKYTDLVLEFWSVSKLGYTGDRIGGVIGPEYLMKALDKYYTLMRTTNIPEYIQQAATTFLNSPEMGKTVERMNTLYRDRFEYTCDQLEKLGWPVNRNGGPYYYWGPIPDSKLTGCKTSEALVEKVLKETGALIIPGSEFGKEWQGFVRIAMTQPKEVLEKFFERLKVNGFDYSASAASGISSKKLA